MSKLFLEAIKQRRSYYGLSKEQVVSSERIKEIVREAVLYTPTAFNSQSARVVLLFGEESDRLWTITKETLRTKVPTDKFASTEEKMNEFSSGYGTVLFFEDQLVIEDLKQQFPLYAENFSIWSDQSSGMLQFIIWTALELEGLGASLQHYNPLIDKQVAESWNLPKQWKLIAQMPFGKPTLAPEHKDFQPLKERIKVFQ